MFADYIVLGGSVKNMYSFLSEFQTFIKTGT